MQLCLYIVTFIVNKFIHLKNPPCIYPFLLNPFMLLELELSKKYK